MIFEASNFSEVHRRTQGGQGGENAPTLIKCSPKIMEFSAKCPPKSLFFNQNSIFGEKLLEGGLEPPLHA